MAKELTGYHTVLITFLLLSFHLPFVFGMPLNLANEAKTLSFFFIFCALWDFLWFVLNPHYPLKKFKGEHVWWHKKWLLGLPVDYYGNLISSLLVLVPVYFLSSEAGIFYCWMTNIILFLVETGFLIFISLRVLGIDNWHREEV